MAYVGNAIDWATVNVKVGYQVGVFAVIGVSLGFEEEGSVSQLLYSSYSMDVVGATVFCRWRKHDDVVFLDVFWWDSLDDEEVSRF